MQSIFSFFTKKISFLYDLPIWSLLVMFVAVLLSVFIILLAINKSRKANKVSRADVVTDSATVDVATDSADEDVVNDSAAEDTVNDSAAKDTVNDSAAEDIVNDSAAEDVADNNLSETTEKAANDIHIIEEQSAEHKEKAEDAAVLEEESAKQAKQTAEKTDTQAENNKAAVKKPTALKQESDKDAATEKMSPSGKYYIDVRQDGYHFYLTANNGQLIYDSFSFTTIQGALNGINTFKKTVEGDKFVVYKDKFGRYRFVLNKRYVGENYTSRAAAESSKESVKRFANNSAVIPYTPDETAEKEYEKAKANASVSDNVDWDAVFDKKYKPSGKYEIDKEEDGFHYYLVANNGQLLYSSRSYSTANGAIDGITAFKKAVYLGNFYVDEDKFGKFRYILKGTGSTVMYVGESFATKVSALNNVESVKNFAFTATVVPYEKTEQE